MSSHIANRDAVVRELRRELVGPAPAGKEIDCSGKLAFEKVEDSYGPWRQMGSGEEIITRDTPSKRYGVGVLYPRDLQREDEPLAGATGPVNTAPNPQNPAGTVLTEAARKALDTIAARGGEEASGDGSEEAESFDLSSANLYKPSSMAVSFLAEIPEDARLTIDVSGGRYKSLKVVVAGFERTWWLRHPIELKAAFTTGSLRTTSPAKAPLHTQSQSGLEGLDVRVEVFSRPYAPRGTTPCQLITVCLINRTPVRASLNENSIFQAHFRATIETASGTAHILPYPGPSLDESDEEERSQALLYRSVRMFAAGHGCAADWGVMQPAQDTPLAGTGAGMPALPQASTAAAGPEAVQWVSAEVLPAVETPSITPDIRRKDETPIEVSMAALAGLIPGDNGFPALEEVVALYESWIALKQSEAGDLPAELQPAAAQHLEQCLRCAQRMRLGLAYLQTSPTARRAFELANHAMLLQQSRSRTEPRKARYDAEAERITFVPAYSETDVLAPSSGRGKWRAFQIAFLLMALQSASSGAAPDRDTVELIWFPTGGGKTEAYLGLAAFTLFMSRLEQPGSAGVHVLMRYTLRLLTAQQFQRASGLICAMEYLRRQHKNALGTHPFSIAVWLGGDTTPNSRAEARSILRQLEKGDRYAENKFILSRCPWCQAQLGPLKSSGKQPKEAPRVIGYERQGNTVVYKCADARCNFSSGLPVYVIDEDIYELRPSLIIGTVDKFALLAWKPEAQALFGMENGQRVAAPPNLIIQDELHLISGPLGSMVGLYEALIEELCTDRRGEHAIRPKIVCSTATIRRYAAQIKALYARKDSALFPPPGLDASDSFFAQYAREKDRRTLQRGRMYVGVHAPGLGSLQTAQVRTYTSLLQAGLAFPLEERDPWWTLMLFFNSLRELGTTLSLFQSDIPDYLFTTMTRSTYGTDRLRRLWQILELTGRLRDQEVPEAISALEVAYGQADESPVDVCLASSIVEVGIDIDRLSLLAITGQPKTTAQYIQVAGRVGRRWWERPGLVVTLYGAAKPRDRSHFEKFRTYHERLYAQVEPTSVTPMSPPVLDRALHAVMVAYVRQLGGEAVKNPIPYPEQLLATWHDLLLPRVRLVDPAEEETFEQVFARRALEWKTWKRSYWVAQPASDGEIPLLRMAGAYASPEQARLSWPVPTSMRDVDAECQAVITNLYVQVESKSNG